MQEFLNLAKNALDWLGFVEIGFLPSLLLAATCFVLINIICYHNLFIKGTDSSDEQLEQRKKSFWKWFIVHLISVIIGLKMIYSGPPMVSGSIYLLFSLYYLVVGMVTILVMVGTTERLWKRLFRQNK